MTINLLSSLITIQVVEFSHSDLQGLRLLPFLVCCVEAKEKVSVVLSHFLQREKP